MGRSFRSYLILQLILFVASIACTACGPVQTNESLTVWVADPDLAQKRFSYAMYQFKQDHPDVDVQFAQGPAPVDMQTGGKAYDEYQDVALKEYADQMRAEVMGRSGPDLILFDEDTLD